MDSAAPDKWDASDYILDSLHPEFGITERTIKASIPDQYHKTLEPALAALVDAGLVIQKGKKFYDRAGNQD